ncbi:hypothetical protein PV04_10254 [Phialophora macrospora]|uniref:Uncharacterized protein n=1 Tax=Phialophora macrospora TaxID=1851006 RepID=A0A0D2FTM6_9EURO|nr:hypothetical protein PV04_10254 [Phialophora macrospora]
MSLLHDSNNGQSSATLYALWKAAQTQDAQEAEASSFWQHLLARHEFPEEQFICDAWIRASRGDGERIIDRGIRTFLPSTGSEIIVLCWVEGKGDPSPSAIKDCETQALDTCKKSLESHEWQESIYALTTSQTRAKAWLYEKGGAVGLTPLGNDEEYIEANSAAGYKLRECFERMKRSPPAVPA